jgi:glycosyltransferase involved in cell wall biosynthesis
MRIAYIAPYQGATLIARRPIVRNHSLAAKVKIEVVAELLHRNGHEIEVISQGEVIENSATYYPGFREPALFHRDIAVQYASALPLRFINGFWSSVTTLQRLLAAHRRRPFDVVIIYNLKLPQMLCGWYAQRLLRLPVILEYEDDAFVEVDGQATADGFRARCHIRASRGIIDSADGCIGVSPHLLSQVPVGTPKLLLRGVVSDEIVRAVSARGVPRQNRVVFSGTLYRTKGLEQLITAWKTAPIAGWELHIAGTGELEPVLRKMAENVPGIVFHGLLGREDNAQLLRSGRIGINPHDLSHTPGNVFAFKIVEYLAAGLHVLSTPMGPVEAAVEAGISYLDDNAPETIATALRSTIQNLASLPNAEEAALAAYGPAGVAKGLEILLDQVFWGTRGGTDEPRHVPAADEPDQLTATLR